MGKQEAGPDNYQEQNNASDPYLVLGVSQDATIEEIGMAYRKLAGETHPDAGGDSEDFKKVDSAYRFLKSEHEKKDKVNPVEIKTAKKYSGERAGDEDFSFDVEVEEKFKEEDLEDLKEARSQLDKVYEGGYSEGFVKAGKEFKGQYEKGGDKLTSQESEKLKKDFEYLAESIGGLFKEFRERDRERLSPVIAEKNLKSINASAKNLEEIIEDGNMDLEQLKEAVNLINSSVDGIGRDLSRSSLIGESEKSLSKILKLLDDAYGDTKKAVEKLEKMDRGSDLMVSLKTLRSTIDSKSDYINRRKVAFKDYAR